MDARYLRVKNWRKLQHYKDRQPPWFKFYWRDLLTDDLFWELAEVEQYQLIRLWGVAANSSRVSVDEEGKSVPVIAFDEKALRRLIRTEKKIPLEKFVREGWLIPVQEEELTASAASTVLADDASADASALLGSEVQRFIKTTSDAVTPSDASEQHQIREQVERSLGAVA